VINRVFGPLLAVWLLWVPFGASAQTTAAPVGVTQIINNIIRGTPGINTVAMTGGLTVSTTANVDVAVARGVARIPTSFAADFVAASVFKGAGKIALRAVPWVGTALVVKDVADAVAQSGIKTCPPPAFFCVPDPNGPNPNDLVGAYTQDYSTGACRFASEKCGYPKAAEENCKVYGGASPPADLFVRPYVSSAANPAHDVANKVFSYYFTCRASDSLRKVTQKDLTACPIGYSVSLGNCVRDGAPGPTIPATEDDLQKKMDDEYKRNATMVMNMKKHMDEVSNANPGLAPTMGDVSNVPVRVTAPQVAMPEEVVSTRQIPNADGTTSTETVKAQTTVTPQIAAGGTLASPGVTFPSTTTTTTTITNNTTNVTNESSTTVNNPAPPAEKLEVPTDYNREATQKAILQQLDGTYIGAVPEDQDARQRTELAKTDTGLAEKFTAIPTQFEPDKTNWFSWVWTPPTATCSNSMWSGSVHGYAVSFDLCPWVEKIRDAVGFLFALFGAINIYGNLFRSRDNV
jgi:hypothetical protein